MTTPDTVLGLCAFLFGVAIGLCVAAISRWRDADVPPPTTERRRNRT